MRLAAIGDSLTEGYPFGPEASWVTYLSEKLKTEVYNRGINGDFTAGMLERFERDVLSCRPTHVIILGGANDAYELLPLEQVSPNFQRMTELCLRERIVPILALPTPSLLPSEERFLIDYRAWLRDYAAKNSFLLLDFYSQLQSLIEQGKASELFVDEVHPSIKGYSMLGRIAWESLENWRLT